MFTRSAFGLTSTRHQAERIVRDLKDAEFLKTEISVVFLDTRAGAKRVSVPVAPAPTTTTVPRPAAAVRGALSWIAGIGPVVLPGVAPLIAAGPIAAVLRRTKIADVASALIDFGVPSAEARRYEASIIDGHVLISVHTTNSDQSDRARDIFNTGQAVDVFTIVEVTTPKTSLLKAHGIVRRSAA